MEQETKRTEKKVTTQDFEETLLGKVLTQADDTKGVYCNLAAISHTKNEFVFDFIFTLRNNSQLVSRVIMSPAHAKELHKALGVNIDMFETPK